MAEPHSIGPFILGRTLGEGATGTVKLGFHKDNGFKVAIKIIKKARLEEKPQMLKKVQREIAVLKLCDHPNVIKLYDVYETNEYLFLITEYAEGGELFEYIIQRGCLDPNEALRFFQMLVHGMDYVHSNHLVHRDLKPENLLLDDKKNLKIADFGMAAVLEPNDTLATSCGSPHYASPEVVMGSRYNGILSDTWSIGVILYALVSGRLPFDDENIRVLLSKVKLGAFQMPPFIPRESKDLIARILVVNPLKRLTLKETKQHPYFTGNNTVVNECCNKIEVLPEMDIISPNFHFDEDIILTLESLYMNETSLIREELNEPGPNFKKAFYLRLKKEKEVSEQEDRYDKILAAKKGLPPPLPSSTRQTRSRSHSTAVPVPAPAAPPRQQNERFAIQTTTSAQQKSASPSPGSSPTMAPTSPTRKDVIPFRRPSASKGKPKELHPRKQIADLDTTEGASASSVLNASPPGSPRVALQTSEKTSKKMVRNRRASVAVPEPSSPHQVLPEQKKKHSRPIEPESLSNRPTTPTNHFTVNLNPNTTNDPKEKSVPKKSFWSSFFKSFSKKKKVEKDENEGDIRSRERSNSASSKDKKKEKKERRNSQGANEKEKESEILSTKSEPEIDLGSQSTFFSAFPYQQVLTEVDRVLKLVGVRVEKRSSTYFSGIYSSIEGQNQVEFAIHITTQPDGRMKVEFVLSSGNALQFQDMLRAISFEIKLN